MRLFFINLDHLVLDVVLASRSILFSDDRVNFMSVAPCAAIANGDFNVDGAKVFCFLFISRTR